MTLMKLWIPAAVMGAVLAAGLALAQPAPIALDAAGDPSTASETFAKAIASRYPMGANYASVKADVEQNGFACETIPPDPQHDAPTVECTHRGGDARCAQEWSIDLAETGGALRRPAEGSFARMCVGAVLPPKPR
jgi:hypothetical protein